MEKLCIFCNHLGYTGAGYGEYAEPAELFCEKNNKLLSDEEHFHRQSIFDIEDFRRMIKTAENCDDYNPPILGKTSDTRGKYQQPPEVLE